MDDDDDDDDVPNPTNPIDPTRPNPIKMFGEKFLPYSLQGYCENESAVASFYSVLKCTQHNKVR